MYFVCDLHKYPEELKKNKEYCEQMEMYKQELNFLKKNVEALGEKRKKLKDEYFAELETFAAENNLLPKDWDEKWSMSFNEDSGQLFTMKQEEHDGNPILKILGIE